MGRISIFNHLLGSFQAIVLLGILAGCHHLPSNNMQKNEGPKVNPDDFVKVALLVPGGSGDPNKQLLADHLVNAAKLALVDTPEALIDLQVFETAGTAEQARVAAHDAIKSGAKIIIGPVYAQTSNVVKEVAATKGINVLSFSNNPAGAGDNLFILGQLFNNIAERLLGYATVNGYKSISVVAAQNPMGATAVDAIRSAALKTGTHIMHVYDYPFSPQGIRESAPSIAQAIIDSEVSSLILTADSASGLPLLTDLLLENGVDIETTKMMGLGRWNIPISTLSLKGLRGGWFVIPDEKAITEFNTKYITQYKTPPHPLAGLAYDGMTVFATLLAEKNPRAAQRSQLRRARGFSGANGVFRLLDDGTNERALSIAEVAFGAVRVLSSAPQSFFVPDT